MAYMIERNVIELDGEDGNRIVTHGKVVAVWRKDPAILDCFLEVS